MESFDMRVNLGLSSYKSDWEENHRASLRLRQKMKLSHNILVELERICGYDRKYFCL